MGRSLADERIVEVGINSLAVVAPHRHAIDPRDRHACLLSNERRRPHAVELIEGKPILDLHIGRVFHGDAAVRVAWLGDREHSSRGRHAIDRLTMLGINRTIGPHQIESRGAGLLGLAGHHHDPIGVGKGFVGIVANAHIIEQWKGAVAQFELHRLQSPHAARGFEQAERNRLPEAEQGAGGQLKGEPVANAPAGAGNGDTQRRRRFVARPVARIDLEIGIIAHGAFPGRK